MDAELWDITMAKRKTKETANRLLTRFLDSVSREETEFVDDPEGGRLATKCEAMARLMFKMALGYNETIQVDKSEDGKKTGVEEVILNHKPDKQMIALVYDRLEGRAVPAEDASKHKSSIADKVSNEGVKRIEQAGKPSKK